VVAHGVIPTDKVVHNNKPMHVEIELMLNE